MNKTYKCEMEDCPCCGGELIVETTMPDYMIKNGFYQDGDKVVCQSNCGSNLQISCDDEECWVTWYSDDDEGMRDEK